MAEARSAETIRAQLREMLPELRRRYPIASLGLFGSWARGEQREGSDIDILVEFDAPIGWRIVTLEDELGQRLGAKVDPVPRRALRPRIGGRILAEVLPV